MTAKSKDRFAREDSYEENARRHEFCDDTDSLFDDPNAEDREDTDYEEDE